MQAQKLAATIIDQAICAELSAAIVVASLDESDEYSVLFSSLVALSGAKLRRENHLGGRPQVWH